jgi:protein SCO1/2
MNRSVRLATILLGAAACGRPNRLPYYVDRTLTPVWVGARALGEDTLHRVSNFQLVDQRGRLVSGATIANKIVVASFFYASCRQLCPMLRSQLQRVQASFDARSGVMILSHTIAPESDSVEVLARYARENHMDAARWLLLTGARAEIERLARDSYFVELSDSGGKTRGRLLHTETFVLIDRRGHLRGVYDGSLAFDVTRLIEDIELLRGEAV